MAKLVYRNACRPRTIREFLRVPEVFVELRKCGWLTL